MSKINNKIHDIIEYLSPNERLVVPFLKHSYEKVMKETGLDETSLLRTLEFLSNKNIIKVSYENKMIIELDLNGILYLKHGLPERRLATIVAEKKNLTLNEAKNQSKLSDNEFKAAIGVLKKKALINLVNGNLILTANKEELIDKNIEELFLESLPRDYDELKPEEKYAFENLKSRKNIVEVKNKKVVSFTLTELGNELVKEDFSKHKDMIEVVSPELIRGNNWKGKKFRKYDIRSSVPRLYGGKRHFVNQATEYAKRIWLELGFKEMTGAYVTSGFWNFDALFTAQDHPVREMQDTFFIKDKESKVPDKKLVEEVKKAHEGKIKGSKGWGGEWKLEEARKVLLRTHTTYLSAKTLHEIAKNKEFPAKYFALGKCFRNETVDWSHGFEFNQTEGIVVDENANFRELLGYMKEFFKKMGYDKIRIRPSYFPYTEPSLEIDAFHPVHKKWVELGGAGMFRPEVTIPIFGRHIPVLAWGPGFDRIIMEYFKVTDLREMYKNDINKLREMRIWNK